MAEERLYDAFGISPLIMLVLVGVPFGVLVCRIYVDVWGLPEKASIEKWVSILVVCAIVAVAFVCFTGGFMWGKALFVFAIAVYCCICFFGKTGDASNDDYC